jgi:serine/threonine protein kinase
MIGSTLSHFKITAKLGAGGMGEVYRASDLQLGRDVALKILPESFIHDEEHLARFKREAHLLASLNHPNIASVYAVGSAPPVYTEERQVAKEPRLFIVMELAAGKTLADLIADGPLPVDEALPIAIQIAHALAAAHEQDIVHRDLKPANVKVDTDTSDPRSAVKVLDFGLAKALAAQDGDSNAETLSFSPTLTAQMTSPGVILGTAAYMSPEQARGQEADSRSDIWSFGALLYEMLTGRRAFAGDTVSDTIASILAREPNWTLLPPEAQPQIQRILERCLSKKLHQRTRDIGDVALELEDANALEAARGLPSESSPISHPQPRPDRTGRLNRNRLLIRVGIPVALIALGSVWFGRDWLRTQGSRRESRAAAESVVQRLSISAPGLDIRSTFALSPDGQSLIYAQEGDSDSRLVHRRIDQFQQIPIAGTEGGVNPFFSPDGQWVGFFTRTELKKVPIGGGPSRTIASIDDHVYFDPTRGVLIASADWGPKDTIVFSSGNWNAPFEIAGLLRVSAAGGDPHPLTTLESSASETAHFNPKFLTDLNSVAFAVDFVGNQGFQLELVDLETRQRHTVAEQAGGAAYLLEEYLIFSDFFKARLVAAEFDRTSQQLIGPRIPLVEGMRSNASAGYALSQAGTLVYAPQETGGQFEIVEVSRQGTVEAILDRPGAWAQPRLSADGRKVVFREVGEYCTLWLLDRDRQTTTRLTFESDNHNPVWSPDSRSIVFGRASKAGSHLFIQRVESSLPAEQLTSGNHVHVPTDWSADGRLIAFTDQHQDTGIDLWVLDRSDENRIGPFLATRFTEHSATFSPDTNWIAYTSDETGREEIYVQPFPGPGVKIQISIEGGSGPNWSVDGSEIFFNADDRLMSAAIETSPRFSAGIPMEVFRGRYSWERAQNYGISSDGQYFVIPRPAGDATGAELRIVLNWAKEFDRLID